MTEDFFRNRLDAMIDPRHPLAVLARRLPWAQIEATFIALFAQHTCESITAQEIHSFGSAPRPALAEVSAACHPWPSIRLMVGLLYLKHAFNESDESVCERWAENTYWQYFCGEAYFQPRLPCEPSHLVRFRQALGEEGVEELLTIYWSWRARNW